MNILVNIDHLSRKNNSTLLIRSLSTINLHSFQNINENQIVESFYDIKRSILQRALVIELNEMYLQRLELSIDKIIDKLKKQIKKLKDSDEHKANWQSDRVREGLFYIMDNKPAENTSLPDITSVRNVTNDAMGYGLKDLSEWEFR